MPSRYVAAFQQQQRLLHTALNPFLKPPTSCSILLQQRQATTSASQSPKLRRKRNSGMITSMGDVNREAVSLALKYHQIGLGHLRVFEHISETLKEKYGMGVYLDQCRSTMCALQLIANRVNILKDRGMKDFIWMWDYLWRRRPDKFPTPRGFTIMARCLATDPEFKIVGDYMLDMAVFLGDPLAAMWVSFLNLQKSGNAHRFRSSVEARKVLAEFSKQDDDWRAMVLEAQQRQFERKDDSALALLERALARTKAGKRTRDLDEEEPQGEPWSLYGVDLPWKALHNFATMYQLEDVKEKALLIGLEDFDDPDAWVIRFSAWANFLNKNNEVYPNEENPEVYSAESLEIKRKVASSANLKTEHAAYAAFEVAMHHIRQDGWDEGVNQGKKEPPDLRRTQAFDWMDVASNLGRSARSRSSFILYAALRLRACGLVKEGKALLEGVSEDLMTNCQNDNTMEQYLRITQGYLKSWDQQKSQIPLSKEVLDSIRDVITP